MCWWGVIGGAVLGAVALVVHTVLPALFSTDPDVRSVLTAALVVVAVAQPPVSGLVFVLDGVLIGAGDNRWLAWAQVGLFVVYLPLVLWVHAATPSLLAGADRVAGQAHAVTVLWWAFVVFMVIRGVVLGWRARTDAWLVTGAAR